MLDQKSEVSSINEFQELIFVDVFILQFSFKVSNRNRKVHFSSSRFDVKAFEKKIKIKFDNFESLL